MELADAVCVYYNYVGVARFAHAHKKSSRHVAWPVCFEFGRGYSYIGWEASGVILDWCRCITGVSCTKVLH